MTARKILLYGAILCFLLSIAGCDLWKSNKDNEKKSQIHTFKVYRPNHEGDWLVEEIHEKQLKKDEPLLRVALETLLSEKAKDKNLINIFPENVKVIDIKTKNNLAEINFSKEILDSNIGGSLYEMLIVMSIVNTVTEFPEITSVQFLVAGKKVETIAGHMDVLDPLRRNESIIKK